MKRLAALLLCLSLAAGLTACRRTNTTTPTSRPSDTAATAPRETSRPTESTRGTEMTRGTEDTRSTKSTHGSEDTRATEGGATRGVRSTARGRMVGARRPGAYGLEW